MKKQFLYQYAGIFIIALSVCMHSCGRTVTRVDPNQQIDVSGKWNNTDSRMVAEEMTKDIFSANWIQRFSDEMGKRPTIIVGFITNNTYEHIDPETFTKDLEKAILNNGTCRLVQGGEKRDAIRAERTDQQTNASAATMKKFGQEMGADFILQGTITAIVDAYKKNKLVQYEVSLELSNIQTNEVVWLGSKKIAKTIKN